MPAATARSRGGRRRTPCLSTGLLALAALSACVPAVAGSCQAPPKADQAFIDPATADELCSMQLCVEGYKQCSGGGGPQSTLRLVFSDEFNGNGSSAPVGGARDPRWTAVDMYYSSDAKEFQVYKPDNVAVRDGSLHITVEARDAEATLHGIKWDAPVRANVTSGMVQSWNKFCYTGGYIEFGIKLPGDAAASGFWAAAWLMGNLGRAGYYKSLEGVWPFSYDACEGSGSPPWTNLTGQRVSRCGAARGRGAPEIDVLEYGILGTPGVPQYVHTMQMAPVAPPNTSWMLPGPGGGVPGIHLPGAADAEHATFLGQSYGSMSRPGFPRTGSLITDTLTANSRLQGDSYFQRPHKYGMYWAPGKFVRWYLDGKMLFEVDEEALRAQENSEGQRIEARQVPQEPSYIIMNVALAKDGWAPVDWDNLQLPATMSVDYVRVYQPDGAINVGCDPPGFPTSQYISCNRHLYLGEAEKAAWQLPLCQDIKSAENSFLLGLAIAIAVVAATAIAMLAVMQSYLKADDSKLAGAALPGVRAGSSQAARQASCYLAHDHQHTQELLQHTRPDLLAVARAAVKQRAEGGHT